MSGIEEEVRQLLAELIPRLKKALLVVRIILFGSFSKGNFRPESDIDIAVFIKESDGNLLEAFRTAQIICSEYSYDIQIQIFEEDELETPAGIVEEVVAFGKDITDIMPQACSEEKNINVGGIHHKK